MAFSPAFRGFQASTATERGERRSNAHCATLTPPFSAPVAARGRAHFCAAARVETSHGTAFLAADQRRALTRTKVSSAIFLLGSVLILICALSLPRGAHASVSEGYLRGSNREKKTSRAPSPEDQVSSSQHPRGAPFESSVSESSDSSQLSAPSFQLSPAVGSSQPPPPPHFNAAASSTWAPVSTASPDFPPQTSSPFLPPLLKDDSSVAAAESRQDPTDATDNPAAPSAVSAAATGASKRASSPGPVEVSANAVASPLASPSLPASLSSPFPSLSAADLELLEATASNKGRTPPVATSRRPFYPPLLPGASLTTLALEKGLAPPSQERKRDAALPEDHYVHAGPLPKLLSPEETRRAERLLKFQEEEKSRKALDTLQALLAQPVQTQSVPLLPLKSLNIKEDTAAPEPCACADCEEAGKTAKRKDGELGPPCECEDCLRRAEEEKRRKEEEKEAEEANEEDGAAKETVEKEEEAEEEVAATETTTSPPSTVSSTEAELNLKAAELRTARARLACSLASAVFGISLGAASFFLPFF
ncbi:conserved hypothetical protein [Neospora caninum Liverpool]|uniref:Uncharacterized protein n=1 Tax=Neospora caninum (strain Liverpool) TaxID=572307 RepID=F0VBU1_NEOCL|nr:conserved hypothetical protein [Neospora caninum Liverpool]CBZ51075.1 conserved hypothetical protein [Neospora caninum Liverpool]CEL68382.1 TPA: hypothetical protein BN1204_041510 [Neospora caninum Liverpool]|eukprot:XP_003881108.1 conserved hypothetical protein [Neospora caninum Liverpool]